MSEEGRSEIIFDLSELNELDSIEEKLIRVNDMLIEAEESISDYGTDLVVQLDDTTREGFKTRIIDLLAELQSQLVDIKDRRDINYEAIIPTIIESLFTQLKEKWETDFAIERYVKLADEIFEANKAAGGDILDRVEGVALDADIVASTIIDEVERSVTTESLTKKDELQDELRAKVQESGITEDIQVKNIPVPYRGTTLNELMSQFDPKTGQFVMAAPYTQVGQLIRERIEEGKPVETSDIAEQIKKDIEEGKVTGPSTSTNMSPALKFSKMYARAVPKEDSPSIVVMFESAPFEEAEAIMINKVTEKKKMEFFDLARRVYGESEKARYTGPYQPDYTAGRFAERIDREDDYSIDDVREEVKDQFAREEDVEDFITDVERYRAGERFTPENPASEATMIFGEKDAEFPEEEITTIIPVRVRPDQLTILLVGPAGLGGERTDAYNERMINRIQKQLQELSPFFNKVRAVRDVDVSEVIMGMGENRLDNYMSDNDIAMAKYEARKGMGPPFVEPAKITELVNKVVSNIVINMGVINASDKQKVVQLVHKIANRYIKEYIIELFEKSMIGDK